MQTLKDEYRALVVGATGGIGAALTAALENDPRCGAVATLDRRQPGFDITDEAAIEAAKKIEFKPARRDGRPVDHTATLRVVFQLA